eukprot:2132284-Pyramimonas_sp.AAC.1
MSRILGAPLGPAGKPLARVSCDFRNPPGPPRWARASWGLLRGQRPPGASCVGARAARRRCDGGATAVRR